MTMVDVIIKSWPIFLGIITLIIILAKMHGDIEIIKEKVKTLFDLWNKSNGK
jgi:ascorbate-specific PTS system EIIC-type component UlaA|tara:strand:- start:212 stop:367 length:156 start_codon:yes stop_codon:yes gene_type:complete